MTDKPHAPIYTCRELAELLAEHDRQYPNVPPDVKRGTTVGSAGRDR